MDPQQFLPKNKNFSDRGDAVNLMNYFLIFWRRKISIIVIFTIIVAVAVIYNLLLPKTFEAQAFFTIGKYDGKSIIGINEIKTIFNSPQTLNEIARIMNLPYKKNYQSIANKFSITTDEKNKSEFFVIKGRGKTPEKAVEMVNGIIEILLKQHQKIFDGFEEKFKFDLEILNREHAKTEQTLLRMQQNIVQIDNDIKFYQEEIHKRSDAQSEGQGRIVENYIKLLSSAKDDRRIKLEQIEQLKLNLKNFDFVLFQKNFEKNANIQMTEVKIPATLPETHFSPNRRQNVKISAFLALIIGILYAFAAEFVAKYRSKLQSTK